MASSEHILFDVDTNETDHEEHEFGDPKRREGMGGFVNIKTCNKCMYEHIVVHCRTADKCVSFSNGEFYKVVTSTKPA